MPIDWSGLEEVLQSRDQVSPVQKSAYRTTGGTYVTTDRDAAKLAVDVVRNLFPDYIKDNTAKISAGPTRDARQNAIADYSLLGHNIVIDPTKLAGRWSPSVSQFFPDDKKKSKEVQVNFTTEEVLTNVNTLLHELYHARTGGGWTQSKVRSKAEKDLKITPEMQKDIAKMASSDPYNMGSALYSIRPDSLDTEEFMANAVTLTDMKQRGALPETGRLREKMRTIEEIVAKYPQIGTYIENQRQPEAEAKKKQPPEPGSLGAIIETIFGPQK